MCQACDKAQVAAAKFLPSPPPPGGKKAGNSNLAPLSAAIILKENISGVQTAE
jgi:hypothetical protein